MINHISIAVDNPEKVANVLAELWNGFVVPFPPCEGAFMTMANDGRGTAVEVTPADTILVPGEGFPSRENFDATTETEEFEAKFIKSDFVPRYSPTHLNINTDLDEAQVREIADREGWRVLTCNRGGGLFQLIEVWIEDRFMLEVMTPEQTKRYTEVINPEFFAQAFGMNLSHSDAVTERMNVIG